MTNDQYPCVSSLYYQTCHSANISQTDGSSVVSPPYVPLERFHVMSSYMKIGGILSMYIPVLYVRYALSSSSSPSDPAPQSSWLRQSTVPWYLELGQAWGDALHTDYVLVYYVVLYRYPEMANLHLGSTCTVFPKIRCSG